MNLHNIKTSISKQIWLWAMGGRGRPIAPINGVYYAHLYEIERGEPPTEIRNNYYDIGYARRNWNPYALTTTWYVNIDTFTPTDALNPLCGRLKSASQEPHVTHRKPWRVREQYCEACKAISDGERWETVVQQDPWYQVKYDDRGAIGSDPVSGT